MTTFEDWINTDSLAENLADPASDKVQGWVGIGPESSEAKAMAGGKAAAKKYADTSEGRYEEAADEYSGTLADVYGRQEGAYGQTQQRIGEQNVAQQKEFSTLLADIMSSGRIAAAGTGLIGGTQESLMTKGAISGSATSAGTGMLANRMAGVQQNIGEISGIASQAMGGEHESLMDTYDAQDLATQSDIEAQFQAPRSFVDQIAGVWGTIVGARGK